MIGQMSTTMSSWTTWYASYQFTVLGEYPGTSATGSPIRSEDPPAAVWSLKEPWTETVDPRMAELLASLYAWMPAEESRRRSERTRAGLRFGNRVVKKTGIALQLTCSRSARDVRRRPRPAAGILRPGPVITAHHHQHCARGA